MTNRRTRRKRKPRRE